MRLALPLLRGSGIGHGRQQRLRVRVARALVHVVGGADLDDLAEVHHRDAVGDVAHHREVVRDEDVREAQLVLQVLEQVDDAGLDRHVERRHRLVEDEQLGSSASARAMPMRWRWPPENSCGKRLTCSGLSPTSSIAPSTRVVPLCCCRPVDAHRLADDRAAPSCAGSARRTGPGRRSASCGAASRMSPPFSFSTSSAVELHRARRRFDQAQDSRPVVDLPQPDSPTSPSVWPFAHRERSRPRPPCTRADLAAEEAGPDREVLDQVLDLEQRLADRGHDASSAASAASATA